nr:MAG TPA: hypothetical protein [Caudoviricetes sp.]DAU79063.1 MAG TPA: hypothetical protein [Caudoviricetes sp.]
MPEYQWEKVWESYYGEKTVGTNRYYIAKAQNDRVDMLIEVQQNRSISAATDKAEIDGVYYRIVQVQQVIDEDGIPMTDLALERVEGLE